MGVVGGLVDDEYYIISCMDTFHQLHCSLGCVDERGNMHFGRFSQHNPIQLSTCVFLESTNNNPGLAWQKK